MQNHLQIITANVADADRLAFFARRTFVEAYGKNNRPEYVQQYANESFSSAAVRVDLEDKNVVYHLAVLDGEILGYVKLRFRIPAPNAGNPNDMQLSRIYVDESKQGLGVGAKLLNAAMLELRDSGHSTIWLAAWNKNTRAQRFYERHGFRVVGRTYFMLGPERQEDVVMACSIR